VEWAGSKDTLETYMRSTPREPVKERDQGTI